MYIRRTFFLPLAAAAVGAATALAPVAQAADSYPSHPITWVVPFTAGGQTDLTSRVVTRRMGELMNGSFVVENRAGAGGTVGTEFVARAAPDGHTMLYVTQGTMAANLSLYKNLRYDPLKDFVPVHAMFRTPLVLVVPASSPFKTAGDLIAYGKDHPNRLNFGSAGAGTGTHLSGELFQFATGAKLTHVPYKGSTPALQDLLGGRIDAMFDYLNLLGPQIKSGKVRALAVLGQERLKAYPDIPSIVELGYPAAVSYAWSGVAVPAGTPPAIVRKISDALDVTLADPAVTKVFEDDGGAPMVDIKLDKFRELIVAEKQKWAEVIQKSGATVN